jgi:hypothetical protein
MDVTGDLLIVPEAARAVLLAEVEYGYGGEVLSAGIRALDDCVLQVLLPCHVKVELGRAMDCDPVPRAMEVGYTLTVEAVAFVPVGKARDVALTLVAERE